MVRKDSCREKRAQETKAREKGKSKERDGRKEGVEMKR